MDPITFTAMLYMAWLLETTAVAVEFISSYFSSLSQKKLPPKLKSGFASVYQTCGLSSAYSDPLFLFNSRLHNSVSKQKQLIHLVRYDC